MAKKIVKGLWIPPELAAEFDREVRRLAGLMPERLETGVVGAAALLVFLRLPSDKEKLKVIKAARSYALDKAIKSLPPEGVGTAEDADRVVADTSARQGDRPAGRGTRRRREAGG